MTTSSGVTIKPNFLDSFINSSQVIRDVPSQLIDQWQQLSANCRTIETFAPDYDYGDLKYNGCRSILRVVQRFEPMLAETLSNPGKPREPLVQLVNLLVKLTDMVIKLNEYTGDGNSSTTGWHLSNFVDSKSDLEQSLQHYWAYYPLYYVEPEFRWALRSFALLASFVSELPRSLVSLISRRYHGSTMVNMLYTGNAFFPLTLINYANNPLTSVYIRLRSIYRRTIVRKLQIARQRDWVIPTNGDKVLFKPNILETSNNTSQRSNYVSCRVMSYGGHRPSGDVIFHVRGGAFVIDVPQSSDTYLIEWLPKLNGAVMIDVDYTRCVRYPIALQELLDLYLWLVGTGNAAGSDDPRSLLGFTPRKIIFCGDSGGAYLLVTLAAVIRDIQLGSPSAVPIFPTALVGFYPLFSFNHRSRITSLILGHLDVFLNMNTVYQGLSLYASGITYDGDFKHHQTNFTTKDYQDDAILDQLRYSKDSSWERFYNTWFNSDKNWYNCDENEFHQRSQKILQDSLRSYISPMVSYDINLIDDLTIFLIAAEFDPFLDMSLDYAKHWKGKVKLDVLEDLIHGFLNFTEISEKARLAANVCLQRLLDALAL